MSKQRLAEVATLAAAWSSKLADNTATHGGDGGGTHPDSSQSSGFDIQLVAMPVAGHDSTSSSGHMRALAEGAVIYSEPIQEPGQCLQHTRSTTDRYLNMGLSPGSQSGVTQKDYWQ